MMLKSSLKKTEKGWKESILKDELSPCYDCLVKMICSISARNGTACEKFKEYIFKRYKELI